MFRLPFLASILAIMLLGLVTGGGGRTTAQETTPVTAPEVPDSALCQVPPRDEAALLALLTGTPVAGTEMAGTPAPDLPVSVSSEEQLPAGAPADAATIAGITTTARELIACNNAGDLSRVFALYTDARIRTAFGGDPAAATEVVARFATPPAALPVEARTTLLAIRGIRLLSDGRAGAVIVDEDPARTTVVFLVFAQVGDRWLVDGQIVIENGAAGTPPGGTPAP